ncbi:MAG: YicC family protein [Sandaracinaceae bacterium]|nr:YicC family protein [Sandaracinaceae bacterium]
MIWSMTGHGVAEAPLGAGRVSLEIRSINHRYLDARVRLPVEIAEHAARVEERVRKALRRGRVEVLGRFDGDVLGAVELDVARARSAFEQLSRLRDELRPEEPVPLTLLAAVPDLFRAGSTHDAEAIVAALDAATDRACEQVWGMREREGAALAKDLEDHLDRLVSELDRVEAHGPAVVDAYRDKLSRRIEKLLEGREVALDPGRLEHEVALLADRADVAEEITRLRSHVEQLRALLSEGEDNAGKRLDFLLQEMTRETNTIGSKSADAELARAVVEMKACVSRMREQAQNVL